MYKYHIIAQKLPMLKQGLKTIKAEFIRTRALTFFVHFRPYATSFLGLLIPLTLMSKGKKTLETSFDLMPSFKTSVEGLVLNVDYLENRHHNFIQKFKTFCFLDRNFSFCTDLYDFQRKKKNKTQLRLSFDLR